MPQITYDSAYQILPTTKSEATATRSLKTLWGKTFKMRAREIAFAEILKPEKCHPLWASVHVCFRDIVRIAENDRIREN